MTRSCVTCTPREALGQAQAGVVRFEPLFPATVEWLIARTTEIAKSGPGWVTQMSADKAKKVDWQYFQDLAESPPWKVIQLHPDL